MYLRWAYPKHTVALSLLVVVFFFADTAATQEVGSLAIGESYERMLQGGETHVYTLSLEPDRFVSGRIHSYGVNVTATVTGPDDAHVERFDSPAEAAEARFFRFRTEAAGIHRIQISAPADAGAGRYVLRLQRVEPVATTPERKVDQMVAMLDDETPGAVVAVVRGGELAFARGFGMANLAHGVPFTPETVTNIGSTAKQFTAFALALLASRGTLSLDDDVRKYVPEVPDFGETVTLRHLLTHTTGYREFLNTLALAGRQVGDRIDRSEVIEVVRRQPRLQNRPGEEWNYNNTAFSLAALVVERVTGRSFPEWMAKEVFAPLEMENTVVRAHPGQIVPNGSMGYVSAREGWLEARDIGSAMGAGSIYTTAADLARWMRNLHTAELGGSEVMLDMTTPFVLTTGDTTSYGLGLYIDTDGGLSRVQHGGGDSAHQSTFVYYPELQAGFVVLSHHPIPGSIGPGVADAFFGNEMVREVVPGEAAYVFDPELLDLETFDAYVGRYELSGMPGVVVTVSREEDRLLLQAPGRPALDLVPTSDSTFTFREADASVSFHHDEDGTVNRLTLHEGGNYTARRLAGSEAADLEDFAGWYFSEELETLYILTVEDGELALRHRRFGPVTLTHTGGDTFAGSFPIRGLSFERDGEGRLTGFHVGNVRTRDVWFERWVGPRNGS